jgi:hypothetical protein
MAPLTGAPGATQLAEHQVRAPLTDAPRRRADRESAGGESPPCAGAGQWTVARSLGGHP